VKTLLASLMILSVATAARVTAADAPKFEAVEQFMNEKLEAAAELTGEQRDKIRATVREQLPALKKVAVKFGEERRVLFEMLGDVDVTEKAIRAETNKLADALVDYTKLRAQLVASLKAVLTSEQAGKEEATVKIARFVDEIAKTLGRE
jgi:Spy/CpxP family protein refolding chaperone